MREQAQTIRADQPHHQTAVDLVGRRALVVAERLRHRVMHQFVGDIGPFEDHEGTGELAEVGSEALDLGTIGLHVTPHPSLGRAGARILTDF